VLLPFFGQTLGDAADRPGPRYSWRQWRRVFRTCATRASNARLNLEIFRDDLDDPVRFGAELQIVVEIARDDAIFEPAREKCRRPGFCRGGEARADNAVRTSRWRRSAAFFFLGVGSGGTMSSSAHQTPAFATCAAIRAPMVPVRGPLFFSIARS